MLWPAFIDKPWKSEPVLVFQASDFRASKLINVKQGSASKFASWKLVTRDFCVRVEEKIANTVREKRGREGGKVSWTAVASKDVRMSQHGTWSHSCRTLAQDATVLMQADTRRHSSFSKAFNNTSIGHAHGLGPMNIDDRASTGLEFHRNSVYVEWTTICDLVYTS